jgi:DNA repair protein SbcC/Rad50
MGIADLFRPKYRHSDARVRAEAVRALTSDDATLLVQIARSDRDSSVRRIAIEKIGQAEVLAELAAAETERSLRDLAGERAAQLWQTTACSDDADAANAALSGLIGLAGKLGEQGMLVDVAAVAQLPAVRKRAFGELRDARALAALAKRDAPQELRTAAVARIDDAEVLRALAIDTTQKEVGLAAVEKLDDIERLEQVAQKAKHKAVRQKARKIVGEIQEAERARKPGVPDEVKRKRAERAQLVREVEAVADTFDFARASEVVRAAQVAWQELGDEPGEPSERFTRAVERFWRRKEIHEQQARSADELRAIEREAAAEKERTAAERAKPEPAEPAAEPDPAREARQAEARARQEERERQRAEDEARRAAQAAEREARANADAERGAAIAASLRAMCDDLEQLATGDHRDTRAVDRSLAQAAKAFEQLGKVPTAERGPLGERYAAVRGKLVTRLGELREAEDWQRWSNVPKAEALIATAKQMLEAEATPDLGNRLRQLQALWKEVGPMPQRRSKELWETFKATCDQVYDKVRGQRAVDQEKFAEVAKVKEALIAEAEVLADSTDWAGTADKLKALQAQWKQSGHLPRKQGDELWKRFRAACDRFFERRKPLLDARRDEEAENLRKKQALTARAQAVADAAPGEGGWGKAIGQIKDLQREWRDVGHVPRRDADAVYKAFRSACDALFAKRDAARDVEANAHRAELDALRAELDAVVAGGDDVVGRALAARAKAHELGALEAEVEAMLRHVLVHHAAELAGTELDPAQLRAKREKVIARVEELLPKQAPAVAAEGDVAAQLKAAMRQNAFADLRWSGRDPVEVLEDLKQEWNEIGPILTDEDHAQAERFEAAIGRVLEANGRTPRVPEQPGESRRRRRRDRQGEQPVVVPVATSLPPAHLPESSPLEVVPDAHADAISSIAGPEEVTATATPISAHDAITQPARLPPELPIGMPESAIHAAEPAPVVVATTRRGSITQAPPMDEVDTGWDLGDDDPTATPSSGEMAGDGAVDDDLDQVD